MRNSKRKAKLITFGNGGHGIDYGRHCRLSGYDRPETFDSWGECPDGTPVIDKRPAVETKEGFSWVFRGPMVNVDLPDGACDALGDVSGNIMVQAMQTDSGNSYGSLAAIHEATRMTGKRGALDHVSLREYIDGWRAVGARIGVVKDRQFVWEE